MPDAVRICSDALMMLGAHPIQSFKQTSDHAQLCASLYPGVRDDLLRKHPWNCAVKRTVLSPHRHDPVFEFSKQFLLPSDCLRVLSVGHPSEDIPYRKEGRFILANVSSIRLRYIFCNDDESTWDNALILLAKTAMAAKLAYAVTGSIPLRDSLTQEAELLFRQAKAIDGQELPAESLNGYPLLESRF